METEFERGCRARLVKRVINRSCIYSHSSMNTDIYKVYKAHSHIHYELYTSTKVREV